MVDQEACGLAEGVRPLMVWSGQPDHIRRCTLDAFLDIISVRVIREYADRPIPPENLQRILEAGRVTGSSVNRQEWKFYVARNPDRLADLADAVYAPDNIKGCKVAIAVTTTARNQFDAGRCIQDMILAAWADGIGSCPNGVRDEATAKGLLHVPAQESITSILSLGYPAQSTVPKKDDLDGILRRIKRKSLEEVTVWVD
jgi:nitroreductase